MHDGRISNCTCGGQSRQVFTDYKPGAGSLPNHPREHTIKKYKGGDFMQPRQAQDIFKSLGFISVTHNGRQVNIEQVMEIMPRLNTLKPGIARVPVIRTGGG
jgi:hypothetical protein